MSEINRTPVAIVLDELARLLDGDAAPSMHSPELAELLQAFAALHYPGDHARVGAGAIELMLARCKATLAAERELAILRDGSRSN